MQALGENQDLSGTRIQSSAPVNVYSGNIRVKVSQVENGANINTGSRDHIVEQLTPVNTWGSVFNIQPIPGRTFGKCLLSLNIYLHCVLKKEIIII